MPLTTKSCLGCKKKSKIQSKKNYNFFTGLFLIILPKCPFCVMAYTSTVFLCSKDSLIENHHSHSSTLSISLTAFFCLLIIIGLLFNYRDVRTRYALALATIGVVMIMFSMISSGGKELYYSGVATAFFAIWLNGSLISILRKFKIIAISFKPTVTGNV